MSVVLFATPAVAAVVLYTGQFRFLTKTGPTPPVPPAATYPTFGGALNLTPMGGISIRAGDANFMSTIMATNPPTFAGVLQQTSFIDFNNTMAGTGTARPGNGPGPFSFAFPSPTGSPPVNPTYGVTKRLGAVTAAGGGANFGGSLDFVFNYVANVVLFGGGGGAPNLACPAGLQGRPGLSFVATDLVSCVGLTTGPLPAMTLPSIMVPRHLTVQGWPVTTRAVFAGAPAPIATTTLTAVGSDVRNVAGTTGMIQLVSPWLFSAQNGLPTGPAGQNQGAVIAEFTISLLPEPGAMLGLLGGLAVLATMCVADRGLPRWRRSRTTAPR